MTLLRCPGPGEHHTELPPSAPAFSLGSKWREAGGSAAPGPDAASYDIAAYQPKASKSAVLTSRPKETLPGGHLPGPADYNTVEDANRGTGPAPLLLGRPKEPTERNLVPGPADYAPPPLASHRAALVSSRPRSPKPQGAAVPLYDTTRFLAVGQASPRFSIAGKYQASRSTAAEVAEQPGPGQYAGDVLALRPTGGALLLGRPKDHLAKPADGPAPGTFSVVFSLKLSCDLGLSRPGLRSRGLWDAGQYDAASAWQALQGRPTGALLLGRSVAREKDKEDAPGPGAYSMAVQAPRPQAGSPLVALLSA